MKFIKRTLLSFLMLVPLSAMAGEAETELVSKITSAYGGDALTGMKGYRLEDHYLTPTIGQSHAADQIEVAKQRQVLLVDLENNRAMYDSWFVGRGGGFQNATLSLGEKAHNINFQTGTYGDANNTDYHVFAGGTMRTSDAILVYEMSKVVDEVKKQDDVNFLNRPHHVLTMPFPSSPDLTLYVDAETFLISKMVRTNPQLGNLDYVYSDYKTHNGVTFGSAIHFDIAGVANIISTKHDLQVNPDLDDANFTLPEGLSAEAERIDTSEMRSLRLGNGVYHSGQNNGYSLFVDTPAGVIGTGGYAALSGRYADFQKTSEIYKPLAYQIVTHHHADHIGGVAEAADLGAKLVTVEENIETVRTSTNPNLSKDDFLAMSGRLTFGEGQRRVEIYEIATIHAGSYLLVYVPSQRLAFSADHYGSPFATGTPVAGSGTVDLLAEIDRLGLDVRRIATAHSARIFTIQEMRKSVSEYQPSVCSANRPVCGD